jgi:hypothetical protein
MSHKEGTKSISIQRRSLLGVYVKEDGSACRSHLSIWIWINLGQIFLNTPKTINSPEISLLALTNV